MNDRSGRSASSAKGKKMRKSATLLLAVGLALALTGPAAMAAGEPIPGVDIIVKKKPPKTTIVVPVDASGTFSVRLKEPGNYTVSTACRAGGCPPVALSINVAGQALQPGADGAASYDFSVGQDGLDLGGQIFVRGAQPIIVNGKRVNPRGVWDDTDIVHVLPGTVKLAQPPPNQLASKIGENGSPPPVERNRLSNPATGGDIKPTDDVLPGAPGNTSRVKPVVISTPINKSGGTAPSRDGGDVEITKKKKDYDWDEAVGDLKKKKDMDWDEAVGDLKKAGGAAPSRGGGEGAASQATGDVNTILAEVSTTRGIATPPGGGEDELPGLAGPGDPMPGTDVGLDHDPEGVRVSTTTTDGQGAFHFNKLPPGKYKLTVAGQPPRSVAVGADGTLGGSVMRGSDGDLEIFDRWGKLLAVSPPTGEERPSKATAEKPVGGFGNGLGGVPGMSPGIGPGGGMTPPGAAPGLSPMGPGAMSPGGGMR
jgi:hypothetical protein